MADFERRPKIFVFILQYAEDVSEYEKRRVDFNGVHILISSMPEACWELEKRNLDYKSIEDYTDFDELYTQGVSNYARLDQLCSTIDPFLARDNSLLRQFNFKPLKDNFYYLKMVLDILLFRISMINTILIRENPDMLILFSSGAKKEKSWSPGDLPFSNSENVFETLLSLKGWNWEVLKICIAGKKTDDENHSLKTHILSALKKKIILNQHPFIFIPLFSLKNFGFMKTIRIVLYQYRNALKNNKTLFALRQEPSWSSILFLLYQKGYHIIYLPQNIDSSPIDIDSDTWKMIQGAISPITNYKGIDFSTIFQKHIIETLKEYIAILPGTVEKTERSIDKFHPIAFLGSEKASIVEHIISHIAQKHHIPVLSWQHGDGPFFPPMQMYVELMNSDIHLSYGPGHQKMLTAEQKTPPFCKVESIGSYSLEKISQNYSEPGTVNKILYVTAGYYYNNIYQNVHPPNDNHLWRDQKQILERLGDSGQTVYFKIWPGPFKPVFFQEFISMNGYTNITTIHNERTFSDLMDDSGIVICDIASTPVIEAIAAHKTIFVLLSNEKYLRSESLALLKKRVYWSDNINTFVRMITDFLEGKPLDQHPDKNNTEYLETFGVHKLDGKVAERALAIIERETHSLSN